MMYTSQLKTRKVLELLFACFPALLVVGWNLWSFFYPPVNIGDLYFTFSGQAINILIVFMGSYIGNIMSPMMTDKRRGLRFALPSMIAYLIIMVGLWLTPDILTGENLIYYSFMFQALLFIFVPISIGILVGWVLGGWFGYQTRCWLFRWKYPEIDVQKKL